MKFYIDKVLNHVADYTVGKIYESSSEFGVGIIFLNDLKAYQFVSTSDIVEVKEDIVEVKEDN